MFEFDSVISNKNERALLVGVETKDSDWPVDSSLDELSRLAFTAGADTIVRVIQRIANIDPATYIGKGKVEEISHLIESNDIDVVIFDEELTPTQQSNLERRIPRSVKVIDRTALILDIFALHAKTKEGRLQVRLAQNQYLYPRLRGMWSHLASNRMGGGVGSRFGEGESQLEVDRRMVRNRITTIKRELQTLSKVRHQQRANRYASSVFKISLAGYTNAGKSSLLNALCHEDVYSDDKLFATLDSTTRKLKLSDGRDATLTDTVGFIQKLPTTLIEAFKSTLDEVSGSDLILHVVDITDDSYERHIKIVNEILGQIGASEKPRIIVFNKCDLLDEEALYCLKSRWPQASFVSAQKKDGFEGLLTDIARAASANGVYMNLFVPYDKGNITSMIHSKCHIIDETYTANGANICARVPQSLVGTLNCYVENETNISDD